MKKKLFSITLISIALGIHSQSKVDIGFQITPIHSSVVSKVYNTKPISTLAFGPKLNWTFDRFQMSAGILHMKQGAEFNVVQILTSQPNGTGAMTAAKVSNKQILAPILMNYLLMKKNKVELAIGGGLYMGINYSNNSAVRSSSTGVSSAKNQINNLYAGVNIGTGLQYLILPKITIEIRPNFLYQLGQIRPDISFFGGSVIATGPMIATGIDFGVFYTVSNKN